MEEKDPLFVIRVSGDGDCALHCMDLTRKQAVLQLITEGMKDSAIRESLLWDILAIINDRNLYRHWIPGVTDTPFYRNLQNQETQQHKKVAAEMDRLNNFYDLKGKDRKDDLKGFTDIFGDDDINLWRLKDLINIQEKVVKKIQDYILQPSVFKAFIAHAYGVPYKGDWQYFSLVSIGVLAKINNLHVIIKRLSAENTYDTTHEYPMEGGRVVVMLQTIANKPEGFYSTNLDIFNHFNQLSTTPGVMTSPIITYSNFHNFQKSKQTNFGVQASPKSAIPGSASFGHDSRNKQWDTLATFSSNIAAKTNSDISGANQNQNQMTGDICNKDTHVNAYMPAVNPLKGGELWKDAKDNLTEVKNKPWNAPKEESVAPVRDEKKASTITEDEVNDIMDDLAERGKKEEVERKEATKQSEEKTEKSILNAPIKPETNFLLYCLDSDMRGRSREVVQESRTKELSPTKIDNTYIEKGKDALSRGIEECYEGREKFNQGEFTLKTVAQGMAAQTLDNLAQLPKFIDTVTLGYASKAGDLIDSGFVALETGVRRSIRYATGNQQMGQDSGQIVYTLAGLAGPKKYLPPVQLITKVLPATKVAAVTNTLETLNLGKAANTERKVLQGLDLAEVNHQLPNVGLEFGRRPKGHIRTNEELIQDIATRAEREIGGFGRVPGIKKHTYSKEVMKRYQEMNGDRGIQFEKNWCNGKALDKGESTKGSVRLDVYDKTANIVYDYKFVQNPGKGLKNDQVQRIKQNMPDDVQVKEINPIKNNNRK